MMFLHFYIVYYGTAETKRGSKFAVVLDSAMAPKQQQSFFAARKEGALKVKSHEKLHGFRGDFFDPFQVVYIYRCIYIYLSTYIIHLESMISCIGYTQDSSYGIILFWYAELMCP